MAAVATAELAPAAVEPDAAAGLLAEFRTYVAHIANRLARRRPGVDADDLLQAGLIAVWKYAGRIESSGRRPGLVGTIASRAMFAVLKRDRAWRRTGNVGGDALAGVAAPRVDPPGFTFTFGELLALADPRDRALLDRRFGGGATLGEIAGELGVTKVRAGQRVARAVGRLRGRVKEGNDPG